MTSQRDSAHVQSRAAGFTRPLKQLRHSPQYTLHDCCLAVNCSSARVRVNFRHSLSKSTVMAEVRERVQQPESAQNSEVDTEWLVDYVGSQLISCSGDAFESVPTSERCSGKHLAFYFSASWCGPCRTFTPLLTEFYAEAKKTGTVDLEVVFVSLDRDEPSFKVRTLATSSNVRVACTSKQSRAIYLKDATLHSMLLRQTSDDGHRSQPCFRMCPTPQH